MSIQKRDRRNRVRKAFFETLENRQLMASDLVAFMPAISNDGFVVDTVPIMPAYTTGRVPVEQSLRPIASQESHTKPTLHKFETEQKALERLSELAVKQYESMFGQVAGYPRNWSYNLLRAFDLDGGAGTLAIADRVATTSFTNIQTSGVDEVDDQEITSDGFVYAVRQGAVFIVDASAPSDLKVAGSYDLPQDDFWGARLHLVGDRLVVVGGASFYGQDYNNPKTHVAILDVSDKTSPKVLENIELEGNFSNSRLVDGKLVLSQSSATFPAPINVPNNESLQGKFAFQVESQRYETKDEYLARIRPTLISYVSPDYRVTDGQGKQLSAGDVGDWKDLASVDSDYYGELIRQTVLSIDVVADTPAIVDSETILSSWGQFSYVTSESVYLVSNGGTSESLLVKIDFDSAQGELSATAAGSVPGMVQSSRFIDEHEGMLRVVMNVPHMTEDWTSKNSIDLYVLNVQDHRLEVIGKSLDIAPGDELYSAEFRGDKAWITTTYISPELLLPIDPLHGIDLSDPTQPKVMSALVIPGVTQYMQWIDDKHLVGVGIIDEGVQWHALVSLYEVSSLSSPKLIGKWESDSPVAANIHSGIDPLRIHYDTATQTLTIPIEPARAWPNWWLRGGGMWEGDILMPVDPIEGRTAISIWPPPFEAAGSPEVVVLKLDPASERSVNELASIPYKGVPGQAVVVGENLFVISETGLSTYSTARLDKQLDYIAFAKSATTDPVEPTDESKLLSAKISLQATGDDGTILSQVSQGDELWITVNIEDTSKSSQGVYAAYVDVQFDTSAFEIVGDAEPLGSYRNRLEGEVTSAGWKHLGGFSDSTNPVGADPQALVRFKLRALADGPLSISVAASNGPGFETLVYGKDVAVPTVNVESSELLLPAAIAKAPGFDVNGDGLESPLDSLIIINHLNRLQAAESESVALVANSRSGFDLDVNQDGEVSLLDVLVLINRLNAGRTDQQSGLEGEQKMRSSDTPSTTAITSAKIDAVFATDSDWQSSDDYLDASSHWNRARRVAVR